MSRASSASIDARDPGRTRDTDKVSKTVPKQGTNDTVTIEAWEDGVDNRTRNAVVVLKVGSDGRSRASVDAQGNVVLDAQGKGVNSFLSVTLDSSDPNNWRLQVGTSGGTIYVFAKGQGGGGH